MLYKHLPNGQEQSHLNEIVGLSVVFLVLTTVFLALRFYARWRTSVGFWWDDWLALIAFIINTGCTATILYDPQDGYGGHTLGLTLPQIETDVQLFYAAEIMFNLGLFFVQWAILALLWRVFPVRSLRIGAVIVWALCFGNTFSRTFVVIFQCTPVAGYWDPMIRKHCIDSRKFLIAVGALDFTFDMLIILLPLPYVWKLQTNLSKKIALTGVFSVGAFACFLGIPRILSYLAINLEDPIGSLWGAGIWNFVQLNIALLVSCMPAFYPLFRMLFKGPPKSTGYSGSTLTPGRKSTSSSKSSPSLFKPWIKSETSMSQLSDNTTVDSPTHHHGDINVSYDVSVAEEGRMHQKHEVV